MACSEQFKPTIDRVVAQAQNVFGSKGQMCFDSYETITSWDMCVTQAETFIPEVFRRFIRPVASTFLVFTRNEGKEMDAIKLEHDERCKEYSQFMFFPPDLE